MRDRILIIDPDSSGHHPNYLGLVAGAFSDAGLEVTVAVDMTSAQMVGQVTGQPWTVLDFRVPSQRKVVVRDFDLIRDQLYYWRRCRELIRSLQAGGWQGRVFFPYLDRIVHAIGLLGSPGRGTTTSGILMRPQFGVRQASAPFKRRLRQKCLSAIFRRAVRRAQLEQVCVIDPLTAADTGAVIDGTALRLTELVDPADCFRTRPRAEARTLLGLPVDGHLVLVYGEIARRKAVAELLSALALRPTFGRALVVGRGGQDLGDGLLRAVGHDRQRLDQLMHRIDRRVSDAEERLVFEAADSVWVAYHDHPGMSGVLVQAGQMGLPVFGCSGGAIGMYCRDRRVGVPLDPGVVEAIIGVLDEVSADPLAFAAMGANGHDVFRHFTRAEFKRKLVDSTPSGIGAAS